MITHPEQPRISRPAEASGQTHVRPSVCTNLYPPSYIQHVGNSGPVGALGPARNPHYNTHAHSSPYVNLVEWRPLEQGTPHTRRSPVVSHRDEVDEQMKVAQPATPTTAQMPTYYSTPPTTHHPGWHQCYAREWTHNTRTRDTSGGVRGHMMRSPQGGLSAGTDRRKGRVSREVWIGQGGEVGHKVVRGRWALPPMEAKGSREGQQ